MIRYVVRRCLWALLLFVAVTFVTYVIFYMAPVSPARLVCGGEQASPTCIRDATEALGIDEPVYYQYYLFMKRLVVDRNLGTSFITRQSVNEIVLRAAPVTASVVFGGAVLWLSIGLMGGILSALRPRSLIDRFMMVFVLIGVSAHPVWIGLIFSYFFGYKWGDITHLPITGYCEVFSPPTSDCGGLVEWFRHLVLPWATFALLGSALYVRMIRATVMETMNEDYVRTARAKGAPESRVMRMHVLRNALLPVVTMLGMDIGLALGGAIFTETVFSLPGLGFTALNAVGSYDLPVVQGIVVFATIVIIFFNLAVDLLYAWVDPRIRLE